MAKVARGEEVDVVTAECGSTTTSGASTDVFVNGTGVHRQGDFNTLHSYGPLCVLEHSTSIIVGSTTVFVNNLGVAREGDLYTFGEIVNSGSDNVFAGD